jgi:hypothetical protein
MVSISQLGLPEIHSAVLKVSASSIDTWVASFQIPEVIPLATKCGDRVYDRGT